MIYEKHILSIAPIAILFGTVLIGGAALGQSARQVRLAGHIPNAVRGAQIIGRIDESQSLTLSLSLPFRNSSELQDLLHRVYDPADPAYGHFLTSAEFEAEFSPTQADYDKAIAYAKSQGMKVTGTYSNRALIDVQASAATAERAFNLHLLRYQNPNVDHVFYAPNADPTIPADLRGVVTGVVGLSNAFVPHPYSHPMPKIQPYATGPNGGLSPFDVKTAYNLSGVTLNGSGQTVGLVEYGGWQGSDLYGYQKQFGLPGPPVQNVSVDGSVYTTPNIECTLDIELDMAMAPNISEVICYNGGSLAANFNRIASDNAAREISCSWGGTELGSDAGERSAEDTALQQMAAQGQTFYDASGDDGAWSNNMPSGPLNIDETSGHVWTTAVGGTAISINSDSTYAGESCASGSGGGVSAFWSIPAWQVGLANSGNLGSTTMRNTPDVSLNMNYGYAIYENGSWSNWGGTSCAAPLWAAFTSLVNQQRGNYGIAPIGFINPTLYAIGRSSRYTTDFHDITSGNNGHFPAVGGYDNGTGWGSFNGANLLADLAPVGTSAILPGEGYYLVNKLSGLALDVAGGGNANGTQVRQWGYNGAGAQMYTFTPAGGGYYYITNVAGSSGKQSVLDVSGGSTTNGAQVWEWQYLAGTNQQWLPVTNSDGTLTFLNRNSGLALDGNNTTSTGVNVVQWAQDTNTTQHWSLIPAITPGATYAVKNSLSGLAMDVSGGSLSPGAQVFQWQYLSGANQKWISVDTGSGWYSLMNLNSGLTLDCPGGNTANNVSVQQWTVNQNSAQNWEFEACWGTNTPVLYSIRPENNTAQVLASLGNGTTNGTSIVFTPWSNIPGQEWSVSAP